MDKEAGAVSDTLTHTAARGRTTASGAMRNESSDFESDLDWEDPADADNPFDLPGDWFVIQSYSGQENKVKINLESRIKSMHMEHEIFEVSIPMEEVVVIKQGKKVTEDRKMFPGYILVRMDYGTSSWYTVRDTPGVIGFIGGKHDPTPLSRKEVERFLGSSKSADEGGPRFKPDWEVGESIRVVTGPFADFNGVIETINLDQSKVTVLVNIFGRDTPTELGFEDIQKN